jgi:hypothetical protein
MRMKRTSTLILSAVLALSMSACGEKKEDTAKTDTNASEAGPAETSDAQATEKDEIVDVGSDEVVDANQADADQADAATGEEGEADAEAGEKAN